MGADRRWTIRVPVSLAEKVGAARGLRSINAEVVARLEASFAGDSAAVWKAGLVESVRRGALVEPEARGVAQSPGATAQAEGRAPAEGREADTAGVVDPPAGQAEGLVDASGSASVPEREITAGERNLIGVVIEGDQLDRAPDDVVREAEESGS